MGYNLVQPSLIGDFTDQARGSCDAIQVEPVAYFWGVNSYEFKKKIGASVIRTYFKTHFEAKSSEKFVGKAGGEKGSEAY